MKKLGLITLLTLPFLGFSQIPKDTLKTNKTQYMPKTQITKSFNFQDINQNQKTQYTIPLNKKINFFTEYYAPNQPYRKPETLKTPEFKAGLKIKL